MALEMKDRDLVPVRIGTHQRLCEDFGSDGRCCFYLYLPYLHLTGLRDGYEMLEERAAGSVILYRAARKGDRLKLEIATPPIPCTKDALSWATQRVREANGGGTVRIRHVESAQMAEVARAGFALAARDEEFVYDRARVLAADGHEYKRFRREISKSQGQPDLVIREYRKEDRAACLAVLGRWRDRMKQAGLRANGCRLTATCLRNVPDWPETMIRGRVVEIAGEVRGMAFSGPISPTCGSLFISINDTEFRGISQRMAQNQLSLWPNLPYFNDGHDNGRAGLADMKQSFRPVRMNRTYRAHLTP